MDEFRSVVLMSVPSFEKTVLVPNKTYLGLSASVYGLSADKKFVYLAHDYYKVKNK